MKNNSFLLVLILAFTSLSLSAQISIGFQTGISEARQDYGDILLPVDAETEITGYHVSALAYAKINNFLSLGVEPGYSRRGAACVPGWNSVPDPTFRGDTKFLLHYFETPIMLALDVPILNNKLFGLVKAGYGASVLAVGIQEQDSALEGNPAWRDKLEVGRDNEVRRIDHGAYFSAGLRYQFKTSTIFITANHYRGQRNVDPNNTSLNRDIGFRLGWMVRMW